MMHKTCVSLIMLAYGLCAADRGRTAISVGIADEVIAQIADGAGWKTSITLMNLEETETTTVLNFWASDGKPLDLPIAGVGRVSTMRRSLPVGGCSVIETEGVGSQLLQGWVELDNGYSDVAAMAIFRQRVVGRPDFEAVVPVDSRYDDRFVLAFDNTGGFITSVALVNPSSYETATVYAVFRDEAGRRITLDTLRLGPRNHTAFAFQDRFPEVAGRRGVVEFSTTAFGVSALGLRFNPGGAFTSFPAFTAWW